MNRGLVRTLLAATVVTVALYALPGGWGRTLGRPLVWLSTLAHELGHGLTAVVVGGRFDRLVLHLDASGAAVTATSGRLASAAVSAGGLLGPPVAAVACFLAARTPRGAHLALKIASVLLAVVAVVWVRNLFGFVFTGATALALGVVGWRLSDEAARFVAAFLGVQLSLSVYARSSYLFTPTARTASGPMPSDVMKLQEALFLPWWLWGSLIGVASLGVLGGGLWLSVRGGPADGGPFD